MPTAADNQVFIKWNRLTFEVLPVSGYLGVTADVTVNVAGTLVNSFTTFVNMDTADFLDDLDVALDDKRTEYVTP